MIRNENNPLIAPKDIAPSLEVFKVDGSFNAGVTMYDNTVIMLLRIAESVKVEDEKLIRIPVLEENNDGEYELVIKSFDKEKDSDTYDFSDSRSLWRTDEKGNRVIEYLTSMSHFRIARSEDGIHFTVDEKPFIFPEGKYETWGIEDPRITKIEDEYYINYTAVSKYGAATALVKTSDFVSYERLGIIFPAENKDVCLFSEKIDNLYYAYHRPVPKAFGNPDIWVATSPDLIHWGNHKHLLGVAEGDSWESGRIGGGAPSFKTEKGWIHIYHAADKANRYCLGAFITALDDPTRILAKSKVPIIEPEEDYEKYGFFGNVIFTCGLIVKDATVNIYYGAADEVMAVASITIPELYKILGISD